MSRYICDSCGASFNFAIVPSFCPICGKEGAAARDMRRAKETAQRLIAELNGEDIPVLESLHAGYIAQLAKINAKMETLRQYKKRGIVAPEEMPVVVLKSARDALKEYREQRREEKKDAEA